jgi:1,4-dihydroxy-2-naphthoate octaprenyltransferase
LIRNFLIHLRLPFQLLLAPFMLFGAALAHARATSWRFALAFVVLHVCIYGGTTAFNSHYDKDEGPIGGLEKPPPPGALLLPGSIALQALGLAAAIAIGSRFFAVCAAFAVLGFLYSHPSTRLKARPLGSVATVALGQGVLGALAGVALADDARASAETVLGVGAAAALVSGLYPISQVFQIEEDRARGDRTAAMLFGRRGTAIASSLAFAIGCACLAASAWCGGRSVDAIAFVLAPVPMSLFGAWACKEATNSFRRVLTFQTASAAAFGAYAVARLAGAAQLR